MTCDVSYYDQRFFVARGLLKSHSPNLKQSNVPSKSMFKPAWNQLEEYGLVRSSPCFCRPDRRCTQDKLERGSWHLARDRTKTENIGSDLPHGHHSKESGKIAQKGHVPI